MEQTPSLISLFWLTVGYTLYLLFEELGKKSHKKKRDKKKRIEWEIASMTATRDLLTGARIPTYGFYKPKEVEDNSFSPEFGEFLKKWDNAIKKLEDML